MSPQSGSVPVLILREGSGRSKGRDVQTNNIMAAKTIAEAVRSSLGPRGMDKMLVDSSGDVSITSDGRTILDRIDIEHPVAKMMVEVAKTQDDEVGDGTTTSVIVTGELLRKAEILINKGVHPMVIVEGYIKAGEKALETLEKIAISVEPTEKEFLKKVATTSMASKLVSENKKKLATIVAEAVIKISQKIDDKYSIDLEDISIEKKPGESISETRLIEGVILDKEVVHTGMPKRIENAKIVLIESALEIKKSEFDTKINIESPEQMETFLKEEENMLKAMAEKIADSGANVVVCQKGIDDVVQHFLTRKRILAIKQAKESDMKKIAKATGAKAITNLEGLTENDLGYSGIVEEQKIGNDKMIFIEECKNPYSVTIFIRGADKRFLDEAERSIHDALCVVRDVIQDSKIVAGGGSPEMEIAKTLRDYAETLPGREQLAVRSFGEAMEIVPLTLGENAGLDPIDLLLELRTRHEKGEKWAGVEVFQGKIKDMRKMEVFEPLIVKEQIIKSAIEATTMILRIDDVISSGKMKMPPIPPSGIPSSGY